MKKILVRGLVALLLVGLVLLGLKALKQRSDARAASQVTAAAPKASVFELMPADVYSLAPVALSQGLPISGSIKAPNTALVKARVAGELQGLTVREGDSVKAGQILARVDSTEYQARTAQAQQSADAAKAQIDIAQRQYDNNKALVDQGFISKTALDTSLASLQSAQANHKAALAALDVSRTALRDTALAAPISGVVSQRLAQPGERVGVDARVLEIVDLSRLELEAQLAAADSVDVRVGQAAKLKIEGRAEEIAATLVRINPSAMASNRSVLAYFSVAALPGLRQGLFAQGSLQTQQTQVLAAPLSAVRTDKPKPYVQLVREGQILHQAVELGARGESAGVTMVALGGVQAGDLITLSSSGALAAGTKVKVAASNPAGKAAN
jgi:RND family efflux transporter MFP subunit